MSAANSTLKMDTSMNEQSSNTNEIYQDVDEYNEDEESSIDSTPVSPPPPARKQSWREIFMLSFSSLGAIYGDLGTSPLYTMNSIKYSQSPPNKDDVYGGVSIIFYVFTIIVIFKYVCIVLVFGPNNGEGGQVAIYAKIARFLKIGPKGVVIPGKTEGGELDDSDLKVLARQDTSMSTDTLHSRIEQIKQHPVLIKILKLFILGACFFGCSLVMSDGLLTPTTSVLSAIGGIQIAVPSFNSVLAVSEVILVVLFLIQQFGSTKISFTFAPIICIWMFGLIICGIYNIVVHHPGIFAALSPYYAIKILRNGGIDVFGGAMLAITGTEAMFADIGHFGKLPIQLTLSFFVYPALILCYLGQGAYLVKHPDAVVNPFFISLPGGTGSAPYWIMFVLSTLSSIIASQALILSVFSITSQLINLDCFPKLRVVHVSHQYAGKVYIPTVNWMLMIGVVCTAAGFKNSNNVTAAYGLGISLDLIVTSSLIVICLFYVYNTNIFWPVAFAFVFIPLEACLVIANLKKVPHGAWFPLMMAVLFSTFLTIWRWARSRKVDQEIHQQVKIADLYPFFQAKSVTVDLSGDLDLSTRGRSRERVTVIPQPARNQVITKYGTQVLQKHLGVGFMYVNSLLTNSPNTLPQLYAKIIQNFASIPNNLVFVGVRVLSIPYVVDHQRFVLAPMKLPGHHKCIVRFGFMEEIQMSQELIKSIMQSMPIPEVVIDELPVIHFFENNVIQCREFERDDRWVVNVVLKLRHAVRKLVVNYLFNPLIQLTHEYDNGDEEMERILIGGLARI
ncbi:Hak1 potassium transporter [Candida orthopsilosis Co 90-125]|uniref:Hak1 potassium transporter n=1 Tax=Candida orthopsilosis (strain 90-125) TaxID=1136231 RepID=H8WY62_CANO9|nr:Hak1 potassium transporter [Candida orthopsilosis Co 90-125]CCG21009.1 Hak1 potassium transporter [Candida orthopsilosis Co 90-125]